MERNRDRESEKRRKTCFRDFWLVGQVYIYIYIYLYIYICIFVYIYICIYIFVYVYIYVYIYIYTSRENQFDNLP